MHRILPILFNTDMVQAVLDGRKTATRRAVKFLPGQNPSWTGYVKDGLMLYNGRNEPCCRKPPCQLGDILYVREKWAVQSFDLTCNKILIVYADGKSQAITVNEDRMEYYIRNYQEFWKPSIHMPKEASRIWLKVTGLHMERLQDITDAEAEKEGCTDYASTALGFFDIWDSTIRRADLPVYGWDANPWVWVIKFEQCGKQEEERSVKSGKL